MEFLIVKKRNENMHKKKKEQHLIPRSSSQTESNTQSAQSEREQVGWLLSQRLWCVCVFVYLLFFCLTSFGVEIQFMFGNVGFE